MKNQLNKVIEIKGDNLKPTGRTRCIFYNEKTGKTRISKWYKNTFTTAGVVALARRTRNEGGAANEGRITYGAVGTDDTAVAASDIKLGTEVERKTLSDTTRVSNVVTYRVFFTKAEAVATLKESGLFGEAAGAGADSGTLFQHANISEVKTAAETLTVETEITYAVG